MFQRRACEWLLGLGILGAGLGLGLGQGQEIQQPPDEIRFVDLNRVLDKMGRKAQLIEEIKASLGALQKQVDEQESVVKQIASDLQASTPGSREYRELSNRFELEKLRLRLVNEDTQSSLDQMEAGALVESYKDIRRAVEDYRRQNELSAVLVIDTVPIPAGDLRSAGAVGDYVNSRPVVAWDPDLDITETIIKMLN